MLATAAVLALLLQAQDTVTRPIPPDSYADSATAELVRLARGARERNERLVTAYHATVSQRIGVGLRALSRDRMLYRQEVVARIDWRRDSVSRIEAVGAREAVPVATRGDRIPEDLTGDLRSLVLDPAEDYLRVIGAQARDGFEYPLRAGAEADYRYALGDSTIISLPSGKRIRIQALEVTPRRADFHLMAGTLWFDADSHGLVRIVFRPARPYDLRRDADPSDSADIPGWLNAGAEVSFVTLEYGLYENRWWMPRYMAIDAKGTMGRWLNVPLRIERTYDDYEVEGGSPPDPASTFRPAGARRRLPPPSSPADSAARARRADSVRTAFRDCMREAGREELRAPGSARERRSECYRRRYPGDSSLAVVIPTDTFALLHSPQLGPPILAMGDLLDAREAQGLADAVQQLPPRPWESRVELPSGLSSLLRHARYNRIEALSLGAEGVADFGHLRLDALARLGLADLVPGAELSLSHLGTSDRWGITAYRRLDAANPETHPFGPVNSVLGLLAQRDDGEYFRTLGAEVTAGDINSGWWSVRAYAERERPASVETSASLPRLFGKEHQFRPNIVADPADAVGATVTLHGSHPLSRVLTVTATGRVDAVAGDYRYGRGSLQLSGVVTPTGPLAGAITVAAGTSTGTVPVQGAFYLGGPSSLRGYAGGVTAGSAYWLGRMEVGNGFPAARLAVFTDVGWAGERSEFFRGRPLVGVGVGASFLDGLVRIDLSRGLRAPTGTRLDFYFDGIL